MGTTSQRLSRLITAKPMPMPNRAVTMGRPMAMTEPNATSRMIMAAMRPMASAGPGAGASARPMTMPPASTSNPATEAARAVSRSFLASDTGMFSLVSSSWTVA